jgi:glycosyltransferase involved in cell wall biosynthesis
MNQGKILFITNTVGSFVSHRLPIGVELVKLGYDVHLIAAFNSIEGGNTVLSSGIKFHPVRLSRSGLNFALEAIAFVKIMLLIKSIRPSLVHLVTMKPVIYGGLIARMLRVEGVVIAISGLGYLFMSPGVLVTFLRSIAVSIFKIIFAKKNITVIFQNPEDQQLLFMLTKLNPRKAILIKGSGVNLSEFTLGVNPSQLPKIVIMASRLLKDKGVLEYVNAAKILSEKGLGIEFRLVGDIDLGNPSSLTSSEILEIKKQNLVKIYGHRDDIAVLYNESRIVVLPSYREGFPKSLIEAASCGRPIITTDVPGCREAVIPGKTGFLVPPRDCIALALAIERLIGDDDLCDQMSKFARKFAEQEFSIDQVVDKHISIYKSLLKPPR